jgi:hypothetical protein
MENKKVSVLTDIQKKELINALVDGKSLPYSIAVKSHRTKLIQEGFLSSRNQVQIFDDLLNGVKNDLKSKNNMSEVVFNTLLVREQTSFIEQMVKLFKEGWKVVKAYNFYTQRGNTYKYDVFFNIVKSQDKKDFEKLGLIDVKKSEPSKAFKRKSKPKNNTETKITYK